MVTKVSDEDVKITNDHQAVSDDTDHHEEVSGCEKGVKICIVRPRLHY